MKAIILLTAWSIAISNSVAHAAFLPKSLPTHTRQCIIFICARFKELWLRSIFPHTVLIKIIIIIKSWLLLTLLWIFSFTANSFISDVITHSTSCTLHHSIKLFCYRALFLTLLWIFLLCCQSFISNMITKSSRLLAILFPHTVILKSIIISILSWLLLTLLWILLFRCQ